LYTLLFFTVIDSFELELFSAQIPTPQVESTWLLARTPFTVPEEPEA
jgi:hypothetical protein